MARIVFLGTPAFALPTLEALIAHPDHDVVAVITQPDRPAGRGLRLATPPVKLRAGQDHLPVFQPARLRGNPEAVSFLRQNRPDVLVVVAYGQILPPEIFDFPPFGAVNVHASLLPRYRGAAPIAHTILKGEAVTGVTIMKIDQGMDTGAILSQSRVAVAESETTGQLEKRLALTGAGLLVETLPGYLCGELAPRPQDHSQATYAPAIQKAQARMHWERSSSALHNQIRAMNPRPGAFAEFRGGMIKVWMSRVGEPLEPDRKADSGPPGQIVSWDKQEIRVRCGQASSLLIGELQLPGRNRCRAPEFVNGVGLKVGEVLA